MYNDLEFILFIPAVISIPLVILLSIQIDYLKPVIKNEDIGHKHRKVFYGITIFNMVIFSLLMLLVLFYPGISVNYKLIILAILIGILGLNLFNAIVLNKGGKISKAVAILDLIILYPIIFLLGIIVCFVFGPLLFDLFKIASELIK